MADGTVLTAGRATSEDTRVVLVAREALHYTYMCAFLENYMKNCAILAQIQHMREKELRKYICSNGHKMQKMRYKVLLRKCAKLLQKARYPNGMM
jgi:arginyl-tRNA--protein-N-Asp/Glu arginylyltransferase